MAEIFYLDGKKDKNRRLVAGLFWHPVAATTERARKAEVQEVAGQMKVAAAVWRHGPTVQVGLAGKAALGACSAAAIVSKTISVEGGENDFVCATQIPDGRWLYVAQKDGVLLPDGDVLGTEDEIRSRMLADCSAGDFALVYAPEHWGVRAKGERDFLSFMPTKKDALFWHKWWRLRPVRVGLGDYAKTIFMLLLAIGVVSGGVAGWKYWQGVQEKKRIEAARIAAEAAAAQAAAIVVKPWGQMPYATALVRACASEYAGLRTNIAGWAMTTLMCSHNDGLSAIWTAPEVGGTRGAFVAQNPAAVTSPDGAFATFAKPIAFPVPEVAEELQESQIVLAWVADRASKFGAQFKAQSVDAPAPDPAAPVAAAPGTWKTYTWTIASGVSPTSLVPQINTAGLRVTKIMFSNDQWSIEGVLYAK